MVLLGPAALGQARLAVIDLVTGDPPITNEDGTIAVAFNGEIYNFRTLRDRLQRNGHALATDGDTEVIVHLAEELSPVELACELDGMFAFAVWNNRTRELVLARDRFGKKPLFWWRQGHTIVFASEIKAVLAHPAVPRELNEGALLPYLTFGYVPTPDTFFAGVNSLLPGHVLVMRDGREPEVIEYWRPPLPPRGSGISRGPTLNDAVGETRRRVYDAVEKRLISDVPLGAFLSGGIDSSVVVAAMAERSAGPVKTFSVGFDDTEGFDERVHAREVAKRFGTEHVEFVVRPNAVELVEKLLWHHDQPFGDSSAIPLYLLCERTREYVTVALSGDGGDELFAGYERFAAGLFFANYLRLPQGTRARISGAAGRLPPASSKSRIDSVRRLLSNAGPDVLQAYVEWIAVVPAHLRSALLESDRPIADPLRSYQAVWTQSQGSPLLARLLDLNARTYLLDDLLVKADRMSMAHGLEVRSPLLDHQLAEYVFPLPGHLKIRGPRLKYLLKRAFADVLPPSILGRRKQGFGVPLDRWFRTDLRTFAREKLGPDARVRTRLSSSAVDEMLLSHDSGRRNLGHAIWTLLTLELFLRREGW
jgi:asparagine synthase (glutamine-hydrolysing)